MEVVKSSLSHLLVRGSSTIKVIPGQKLNLSVELLKLLLVSEVETSSYALCA